MKLLSLLSGLFLFIVLFSTATQLTSCQKDPEIIRDTLLIKDTVIIKDTVELPCNCDEVSLKEGLVAYYNFNNGTLKDSSGQENHITFNNATKTTDRFGHANNAYLFNGSDNYMQVANSPSLNPVNGITIMVQIKINGFYDGKCHGNQILGKLGPGDYVNGHYVMRYDDLDCSGGPVNPDDMKVHVGYGDNPQGFLEPFPDTAKVKIGQWYTIVMASENGYTSLYVNGEFKYKFKAKSAIFTPNNYDLVIGKTENPQYFYWLNGVIDEIRIYDRALCVDKIKKLSEMTQ